MNKQLRSGTGDRTIGAHGCDMAHAAHATPSRISADGDAHARTCAETDRPDGRGHITRMPLESFQPSTNTARRPKPCSSSSSSSRPARAACATTHARERAWGQLSGARARGSILILLSNCRRGFDAPQRLGGFDALLAHRPRSHRRRRAAELIQLALDVRERFGQLVAQVFERLLRARKFKQ